ncbi:MULTISPECIES: type ISP restriction/modification enzyme [unclassified Rathayibacter]|uniref:type ISP restriction/modification enzyme n=1 Tax=unclassified Rathayibacter TaxID=2609250 RepID=UPI000AA66734|nr:MULTISPECIES: type ISP restriction/modification enzyme [unclassified Rathayibacter]
MTNGIDTSTQLVNNYLASLRAIHSTGAGTAETSYYPALHNLLSGLGAVGSRRWSSLPSPRGINGDFPDVALYDNRSNVLVLPIEVKGWDHSIEALAISPQAKRYAKSFGGGRILVTNLVSFAVSELDVASDTLRLRDLITLTDPISPLASPVDGAVARLLGLLDASTTVRGSITRPRAVADLLAYHGRRMMKTVDAAGDSKELLSAIGASFRDGLGMDLEAKILVPTTVQTVVYGLFAAWLEDETPDDFDWLSAAYRLRLPVYADMIHTILTPRIVQKCNLPPILEDTARMLSWVDRDAFTKMFDGGAIEYFYEPFLAAFDENLRRELGVWYTPKAVAEYQVARVHHHLKTDFGLADGIADSVESLILDPACGTGTYLTHILTAIRQHHLDSGQPEIVASQRAADAAKTRVIGFEILPAAFVIAHINVSHLLASWGVPLQDGERARIYLTNSLINWQPEGNPPAFPIEALAGEIAYAREVKNVEPVLAIIGNPPYEGFSAAETAEERELLKPWIEGLFSIYGVRKHRLGDLYVRFWRVSVYKVEKLTTRGIVSFITNRRWLGGRSFPIMRDAVRTAFDQVMVDDLHGDIHERLGNDGSIFTTATASGIRVGTAIVTGVRTSGTAALTARRRDLIGSGAQKRDQLSAFADDILKTDESYEEIQLSRAARWRFTSQAPSDAPALDEYFVRHFSGVQPVRDDAVLDVSKESLTVRMKAYYDFSGTSTEQLMSDYPAFAIERSRYVPAKVRAALAERNAIFESDRVVEFEYRPMTRRWMYWETRSKLLNEARRDLFESWVGVDGQRAIACAQIARRPGGARPIVTSAVPAYASTDPDARVFTRLIDYGTAMSAAPSDAFDLEVETAGELKGVQTAIDHSWIKAAREIGIRGSDTEVGDIIFYAIIAISASPDWLDLQPAQSDDFPVVPIPSDAQGLLKTATAGRLVADLLDLSVGVKNVTQGPLAPDLASVGVPTSFDAAILREGVRGQYGGIYDAKTETVWWDSSAGGGWSGIPRAVWEYSAGGFPILAKSLAYGVNQTLTAPDRELFMERARRLAGIIAMQTQLNELLVLAVASPLDNKS